MMSGPAARAVAGLAAALLCAVAAAPAPATAAASDAAPVRVEARSAHYRLVGILRGDTMSLHVSRQLDNAPVTDAVVTAAFRGRTYPTTASVDGGYAFAAPDLNLPGSASIAFRIAVGGAVETLEGVVRRSGPAHGAANDGGARQLGWWVLNFAVCIGFLALIARRRKRGES